MRKVLIILGFIPLMALAEPMLADMPKCHSGDRAAGSAEHVGKSGGLDKFIFKDLDLTAQQQADIAELMKQPQLQSKERFLSQHDLMHQLRQLSFSADYQQTEADKLIEQITALKAEELRQKTKTQRQIVSLLTPEQLEKLQSMRKPRME